MAADFERDLSELLHTVTPEPPDHLVSPRVALLPEEIRADAGATVIELETRSGQVAKHRRRWPTLVAAAAIAVLAAGVVAITQIGDTGRPTAHQSADNGQMTTAVSPTRTPNSVGVVSRCRDYQVVLGAGLALAVHGRTGTAHFTWRNKWVKRCALVPDQAAIGNNSVGPGTPFRAGNETVVIPGHREVVFTAHVRVTGRCRRTAKDGPWLIVTGPTGGSWRLGVTGCTLIPLHLTHRVGG